MANNYNDILALVNAGNNMGLSNTIKRDYGIPLDFTSVQETYDAAVIYAATSTLAYVGQTVAVGGKLYIISEVANGTHAVGETTYDNYLAEVGSKTEGDGNTIELDGTTLKLAGLTGLDGSKTYVPSLVNGKLVWAEPDTTTAEGQQAAISALETRAQALEATVNGVEASEGVEAVKGLVDKVADEVAAREAADTALEGKITEAIQTAKDYTNENKYDDTALAGRVKAIEDDYLKAADKYNDSELRAAITAIDEVVGDAEGGLVKDVAANTKAISDEKLRAEAAEKALGERIDAIDFVDPIELAEAVAGGVTEAKNYTDAEIDKVEAAIAALNHFKAEVVDSIDKVTEVGVLYLIKDESVAGVDKYNEYIVIDGVATHIGDTTTDLSNYYNKTEIDGKVEAINTAISNEITAREALAEKVTALEGVDNATQAEFDQFKADVAEDITEAKQAAIADADGKLANKVNTSDFEQFKTANTQAIADAKQAAIDAAAEAEEAKGYAIATEVETTYVNKADFEAHTTASETTYAKAADVNTELAKKLESGSIAHTSESVAEGVTVEGTELKIVVDAYTKAETLDKIQEKITEINGGESAGEVLGQLNSYKETNDTAVAAIQAKNSEQDTAIAAAKAQADQGVADAKTANDAITALTSGQVKTNTDDISAVKTRLTTLETAKGEHESRIGTAESKIAALETFDTNVTTKFGELDASIKSLGDEDTRIVGLVNANTTKFNDYSTTEQMNKAIDDKIAAIPAVDLEPYAKTADVNNAIQGVNAELATKANAADIYTKTEADNAFMTEAEVDARINTLIVGSDPEGGKTIENIQNLVKFVDENAGEIAALVTTVGDHSTTIESHNASIAALNDAVAAMIQPKASAEITIAEDGTLGIGEVNVNKLAQTAGDILVLNGGSAV